MSPMTLPSASFTKAVSLPTNVFDLLLHLCAGGQDRLQPLADVIDVPVADGRRHALAPHGRVRVVFEFTITQGKIIQIGFSPTPRTWASST
jgi:hypothetical protein